MSVRKYHRKDGEVRWLGMIEEGRDPKTGRRVQASKSFLTKRAAERWCREQTRHIERGEYVESTTQTVGKFLDKWLEAVRPPQVRESTWASFDSHVKNHLKPRIGAVRLQQLDRGRILGLAREF